MINAMMKESFFFKHDFEGNEDFPAGNVLNSTRAKWNDNFLGFGHSFR
jgi:hypothetical protein